jgi:glucose-6-phosphate isomerase
VNATPPTDCPAWAKLAAHEEKLRGTTIAQLFARDAKRATAIGTAAPGLTLDCSRQRVTAETLALLAELAAQRDFDSWRRALFAGEPLNTSEGRAARHAALRAGDAAPNEVKATLARMRELAARARRRFRRVVHLGTGGSYHGPRLVADALGVKRDFTLEPTWVASHDPVALERALAGAEPGTTLFVVVSKTFATEETLANAAAARRWLGSRRDAAGHFIAVTANERAALEFGAGEVLPMWDWVGGRFSVWSAASFCALLAAGEQQFDEFLAGARDMDEHFRSAPLERNLPALMAMIGVWNVNFLGAATHAVLPYAHALRRLPAWVQQLEMESNGKSVDRDGRAVGYTTSPVVFGEEGTAAQHTFHQLLHQGTQAVPADFIVTGASRELDAHAEAQAHALAFGSGGATAALAKGLPPTGSGAGAQAHLHCPGNRPSSTLRLERLDARNLGRLLACWEHKVFTQGAIWNLNSFDQWGVELGKQLARKLLSERK